MSSVVQIARVLLTFASLTFTAHAVGVQPVPLTLTTLSLSKIYPQSDKSPNWLVHSVSIFTSPQQDRVKAAKECVRRAHPGVAASVAVEGNGTEHHLLVAAHVSSGEANDVLQALRRGLDYDSVTACLHKTNAANTAEIGVLKAQTRVLEYTPNLAFPRSPPDFDGIGVIRRRNDGAPRQAIVEGRYYSGSAQVAAAMASLQGRYPDLHFVAIRHDGYYFVAVTSLVDENGLKAALHAMRLRGAHELTVEATFKSVKTTVSTPDSTDLIDLRGTALPKPPPSPIIGEPIATEVLEYEDLFESRQQRVARCYQGYGVKLNTGDGLLVDTTLNWTTVGRLTQCAGVVMYDETLTRCLVGSDCSGMRLPPGFGFSAVDLVHRCMGRSGGDAVGLSIEGACATTRLDPIYRAMMERYGILSCLPGGNSQQCGSLANLVETLCQAKENRQLCADAPNFLKELRERTALLTACLSSRQMCERLVPRRGDVRGSFEKEVARLRDLGISIDFTSALVVQTKVFGALADANAVVDRFRACNDLRGKDDKSAADCFMKITLNSDESAAIDCLRNAGSDVLKQAKCFAPDGSPRAAALERAQCASQTGGDLFELARCAGSDSATVDKVVNDYQCVSSSASAADAALNCVSGLTAEARQAIHCAKQLGMTTSGYEKCLAGINGRLAAAQCMSTARDNRDLLACAVGNLPLNTFPATARQAMDCALAGGDDLADIGTCMAATNLPPEVNKALKCAGKAVGAVDFALCAVDVGLNPELRIAAECATSTGGEPVSWAACSGGRLTVRELQKCLSGEIGKEGGCFGPNNELVKILNNAAKDLTQGLGPGNEIVRAVKIIEGVVNNLGGHVSNGLRRVAEEAKRGDIGKVFCGIFGC